MGAARFGGGCFRVELRPQLQPHLHVRLHAHLELQLQLASTTAPATRVTTAVPLLQLSLLCPDSSRRSHRQRLRSGQAQPTPHYDEGNVEARLL